MEFLQYNQQDLEENAIHSLLERIEQQREDKQGAARDRQNVIRNRLVRQLQNTNIAQAQQVQNWEQAVLFQETYTFPYEEASTAESFTFDLDAVDMSTISAYFINNSELTGAAEMHECIVNVSPQRAYIRERAKKTITDDNGVRTHLFAFLKHNDTGSAGFTRPIGNAALVNVQQEMSTMVFLDAHNEVIDWVDTLNNLRMYAKDNDYAPNMVKNCLMNMVRIHRPQDAQLLGRKDYNEIACFLLQSMAYVDKRMYYLERLDTISRKPKEALASAVSKVKLLADQLFPAPNQQRSRDNVILKAIVAFTADPFADTVRRHIKNQQNKGLEVHIEKMINHVQQHEVNNNAAPKQELHYDRKINKQEISFMNMQYEQAEPQCYATERKLQNKDSEDDFYSRASLINNVRSRPQSRDRERSPGRQRGRSPFRSHPKTPTNQALLDKLRAQKRTVNYNTPYVVKSEVHENNYKMYFPTTLPNKEYMSIEFKDIQDNDTLFKAIKAQGFQNLDSNVYNTLNTLGNLPAARAESKETFMQDMSNKHSLTMDQTEILMQNVAKDNIITQDTYTNMVMLHAAEIANKLRKDAAQKTQPRRQSKNRSPSVGTTQKNKAKSKSPAKQNRSPSPIKRKNRSKSNNRRQSSVARFLETQKMFPNLKLGVNARPNYRPMLEKACVKCMTENLHHEHECDKYSRYAGSVCIKCNAGYHFEEDCKQTISHNFAAPQDKLQVITELLKQLNMPEDQQKN